MRLRFPALLFCLFVLLACDKDKPQYVGNPAIKLSIGEISHHSVTVLVESLNTDEVFVMVSSNAPSAEELVRNGSKVEHGRAVLGGLESGTRYTVYGVGVQGSKHSKVEYLDFVTSVEAGELYTFEEGRDGAPFFADITLCTGGGTPNSNYWFSVPATWDAQRFAPHVSYTDSDGEHWLFEAFLAITGIDFQGKNYGINANGRPSADKQSWEDLAEYWAGPGGAFSELDKAIGEAARSIGGPAPKRYAVMVMPDPVMFETYSDKSSSTRYWGALEGKQLDFSSIDDQIAALQWYIDLVRQKFAALGCQYLELGGFYILSEELVSSPEGWNYAYKRWDRILPKIGEFLDARNEGLYWIPYLNADGTSVWKNLGISYAWLQPGRYWDYNNEKPIASSTGTLEGLGMGMELEFEYSMVQSVMEIPGIMGPDAAGRYVFTLKDVPSLRARFREYMSAFKNAGLYGKSRLALYSGSNALYQLATSPLEEDRQMYLELCRYITGARSSGRTWVRAPSHKTQRIDY